MSAGAFVRCESRHHALSLFSLKTALGTDQAASPPYGLHHIAFEVSTSEELLLYRRFRASGEVFVQARVGGPGNQPRFYGRDPDGNLLEFYWGIDRIGWDGMPVRFRRYRKSIWSASTLRRTRQSETVQPRSFERWAEPRSSLMRTVPRARATDCRSGPETTESA